MFLKLYGSDEYLICGSVSKAPELKFVGQKETALLNFSVYTGKDEYGTSCYVDVKAWRDLADAFAEMQRGDSFCGIGKLERCEYNGRMYESLVLIWGNCPVVSPGPSSVPSNMRGYSADTSWQEENEMAPIGDSPPEMRQESAFPPPDIDL